MLSHPLTFLIGYLFVSFAVSFLMLGPLVSFVFILFSKRHDKRYSEGLYLGSSSASFAFMVLHYLLYLRGYSITNGSTLFKDIFYPPSSF